MSETVRTELRMIDTRAIERLEREMAHARKRGYTVEVGTSDDEAYQSPQHIYDTYHYLRQREEQLSAKRQTYIASHREPLSEREFDRLLEPERIALLYGPVDATPWHNQRGHAAALLSIVAAHQLAPRVERQQKRYPTMSGPLDERVLSYHFDARAGQLDGMSIAEALVWAKTEYGLRDEITAREQAQADLHELTSYLTAPSSKQFTEIVRYCVDALGIRARKDQVHEAIRGHILARDDCKTREFLLMSFGCGTAYPMLEVVADLKQQAVDARLILLDQDPLALAAAALLADDMGLGDKIEIHCERLFSRIGRPLKLETILRGRQLDIAEDSGLREYLPWFIYRWLTGESWRALREGGLMTTGNMNVNRPQAEFPHGLMGWLPHIRMRTIERGLWLHRLAGIPKRRTRVRVTPDGVYTLYFTTKSA